MSAVHHVAGSRRVVSAADRALAAAAGGAIVCWAFGPRLKRAGRLAGLGASSALRSFWRCSRGGDGTQHVGAALGAHQPLVSWMPGTFDFGLLLDPLSLLWTFIITGVGFLIHFYSIGYMDGDQALRAVLRLHEFLRLRDAHAGALRQLRRAARRLGSRRSRVVLPDRLLVRAPVGGGRCAQSVRHQRRWRRRHHVCDLRDRRGRPARSAFGDGFAAAGTFGPGLLFAICIGLFIGAAAKSAQIPLHTWLPDAMEGPTPVSALIHAATMVTAGVYLIARCAPLWNASADAQELAGVIGGLTAICRRDSRLRAVGYQAHPGLLDDVADRLHDHGRRRRRVRRRRRPFLHARIF